MVIGQVNSLANFDVSRLKELRNWNKPFQEHRFTQLEAIAKFQKSFDSETWIELFMWKGF